MKYLQLEKKMHIDVSDGLSKHPEHLRQHNHLQILHRQVLQGSIETCKEMIAALPQCHKADTIAMLKAALLEHNKHKAVKIIKELNW